MRWFNGQELAVTQHRPEPMAYKHFWRVLEHAQGKFDLIVLSTGHAPLRPLSRRCEQGLLHRVLAGIEPPVPAGERGEARGTRRRSHGDDSPAAPIGTGQFRNHVVLY